MGRFADYRTAILGFLVAAAYWPGMLSAAFVPRWGAIAVGVPLLTRMDPRDTPLSVRWTLLWVFVMALIATAFTSPDPMTGYLEGMFFVLLCLSLFAGSNLDTMDHLMTGLGAGLALSSGLAVLQFTGLWSPVPQSSAPAGLFFNSEVLAEFAALVFIWAILRPRWGMAGIALIPVILSHSRVSMVMIGVGLFYALRPKTRVAAAVILLILVVLALSLIGMSGYKLETAGHRMTLWLATIGSWNLAGQGLGWAHASFPMEGTSHSDVLQIVAELGVAALPLVLIPVMVFYRQRGTHAERATFAAAIVGCCISFPLHFPASAFLVAVLAGYLLSNRHWVCDTEYRGRPENGAALEFWNAARLSHPRRRGFGGFTFPLRSFPARATQRNSCADIIHPGAV